jgi:hypothetical protein
LLVDPSGNPIEATLAPPAGKEQIADLLRELIATRFVLDKDVSWDSDLFRMELGGNKRDANG